MTFRRFDELHMHRPHRCQVLLEEEDHDDVAEQTAAVEGVDVEEGKKKMGDFRYLV